MWKLVRTLCIWKMVSTGGQRSSVAKALGTQTKHLSPIPGNPSKGGRRNQLQRFSFHIHLHADTFCLFLDLFNTGEIKPRASKMLLYHWISTLIRLKRKFILLSCMCACKHTYMYVCSDAIRNDIFCFSFVLLAK